MGGKGKHDRRMGMHGHAWACMGMHGHAWEARESMIDAWGCMGTHGDAWGGMGRHGEALGSEDVELAAVLIVGAEGLECFGSHTEDEVVGEDRVVVLEYGCDLTLGLAFQVKAD